MSLPYLSRTHVRHLLLAAQGLSSPARKKAGKPDVLACIRRMSALQIDTIHVVARSPYLVLFSRLGEYDKTWLEALLAEGHLFEYWSHEACFLPIEDFGLYRHRMLSPESMGWKYSVQWREQYRDAIASLLTHIRENGPVRSSDFERRDGQKGGGWWCWKPEKRSLEVLLTAGELMVKRRHNFQRLYDLRERVLPSWSDDRDLRSADACLLDLWEKAIKALGAARISWIGDYFRTGRRLSPDSIAPLLDEGRIFPIQVEGWKEPLYVHHEHRGLLDDIQAGRKNSTSTCLLSPFDPVIWDRRRTQELFDFDYRLECYTPEPKRQYGYFVLPILSRGRLVGRLDAKAHRRDGVLEIKAFYWEPGVRLSTRLYDDVGRALRRFADWHETPTVRFARADSEETGRGLARHMFGD